MGWQVIPILTVLWKYKTWVAIAALVALYIGQIAYTNHLAGKLKKAEATCTAKIQKIEQANLQASIEKQNEFNQLSADYEQAKTERKTEVEYRTREVQKIIERPVYINTCADADGMSELNSLIKSRSAS